MKKNISLIVMCSLYILAGLNHFINPGFYLKIMPKYIPYHLFFVYATGVIEIALGALAFTKKYRKIAGWLLIAMLVAFLPVHMQMVIDHISHFSLILIVALLRLPFQFVLIYWVYKICRLRPSKS